jgi:hypothetical protein
MVRSETLTVIGDGSPRTLRDIAIRIEQFRDVVSETFPGAGRTPGLPTVVYVFSTRERMKAFLPLADGKPAEVAGLMSRDGEVNRIIMSSEGLEESASVAFHEYTHLLIGNTGRRLLAPGRRCPDCHSLRAGVRRKPGAIRGEATPLRQAADLPDDAPPLHREDRRRGALAANDPERG